MHMSDITKNFIDNEISIFNDYPIRHFVNNPLTDSQKTNQMYKIGASYFKYSLNDLGINSLDELNNYGQRCENFLKLDNSKNNILFAGCSITFGMGINKENVWSKKVYNYFLDEKSGRYNSISYIGGGIQDLVSSIFDYCKLFGMPNTIFFLMPDFTRTVIYEDNTKKKGLNKNKPNYLYSQFNLYDYILHKNNKNVSDENIYENLFQTLQYYKILENFCLINNIKLISSSWNPSTNVVFETFSFETYYCFYYDKEEKEKRIFEKHQKYLKNFNLLTEKEKNILLIAADKAHPGICEHEIIADKMIEFYNESR
jgi:hypothetical protein